MPFTTKVHSLLQSWGEASAEILPLLRGEAGVGWAQARKTYVDGLENMFPAPPHVTFDDLEMDGVPTLVATPDEMEPGRALLFIHGGGYVHGGARGYRGIAGHYARLLRSKVYIPDYRQAPEHPFPAPIDDTFRVYRALIEIGHDPAKIAISGDSAGGAMVLTVMRKARDAGIPLPVAGVAISPWSDLTHSGESARSRNDLNPHSGNVEVLNRLARVFLGNELASHPDASPIYADLRGLPPILIQMGENEVMLSGGITLAERLADQRVRVTLEVWPGMFHVWPIFAGHMAEADEALDNAVGFLRREFDRASARQSPLIAQVP